MNNNLLEYLKTNRVTFPQGTGPLPMQNSDKPVQIFGLNSSMGGDVPNANLAKSDDPNALHFTPPLPLSTKEISDKTEYNANAGMQQTGGNNQSPYSNEQVADLFNTLNGKQTNYSSSGGFRDVMGQFLRDRATGEGLYKIDPNSRFSPEQINSLKSSADNYYETTLKQLADVEKKKASEDTTAQDLANLSQTTSANNFVRGFLNSVKIGNSAADTKRILENLMTLSPDQQMQFIRTNIYDRLSTGQKTQYDANENASGQVDALLSTLPTDMWTNPYRYNLNQFITYLGGKKDPRYINMTSQIANIATPLRNAMFGASLTPNEQAAANQFLPDPATDDLRALIIKSKNLRAAAEFANDALIARHLGVEKPNFIEYLKKYNPELNQETGGGAGAGGVQITPKGGISF